MNIFFIAEHFEAFVEQIVRELININDVNVYVIAPQSLVHKVVFKEKVKPRYSLYKNDKGHTAEIFQPYVVSFSNYTPKLNKYLFRKAILNTIEKINVEPDLFYCQFWHLGIPVIPYAKRHNTPIFVDCGESTITVIQNNSSKEVEDLKKLVKGVVCVSLKNQKETVGLGLSHENLCEVIPNGVDSSRFFKEDNSIYKKKLGIQDADFVIIYVGGFNERKGYMRVCEALKKLNNNNIKAIFIGYGLHFPEYNNIIFAGRVENRDIVHFLNAADVFVLPTLKEGCCNSILEAMACGLPVISSDTDFNNEILNREYAFMIDPLSIDDIADKIDFLYKNKQERILMGEKAYRASLGFSWEKRADNIVAFIKREIGKS